MAKPEEFGDTASRNTVAPPIRLQHTARVLLTGSLLQRCLSVHQQAGRRNLVFVLREWPTYSRVRAKRNAIQQSYISRMPRIRSMGIAGLLRVLGTRISRISFHSR